MLDRVGVEPPVRTTQCESEKLTEVFGTNAFDLVYARNTLDHSYDPVKAIRSMIDVVKPGCHALLEHAQNEAEEENYMGMHQWNLSVDDGRFYVWRPGTRIDVAEALADVGAVTEALRRDPINRVVIRKHA